MAYSKRVYVSGFYLDNMSVLPGRTIEVKPGQVFNKVYVLVYNGDHVNKALVKASIYIVGKSGKVYQAWNTYAFEVLPGRIVKVLLRNVKIPNEPCDLVCVLSAYY